MSSENGVFLEGTITKIEACQVGYGESKQTIGQVVTLTVQIPYISLPDQYDKEPKQKFHTLDLNLFYAGGVRPPMIGTRMTATIEEVDVNDDDEDE